MNILALLPGFTIKKNQFLNNFNVRTNIAKKILQTYVSFSKNLIIFFFIKKMRVMSSNFFLLDTNGVICT
jgi:hypothetical protein